MGLIDFLDGIFLGKEFLNRCKNGKQDSGYLTPEEITEKQIEIKKEEEFREGERYRKELSKYGEGYIFKLDEIPESFKDKLIKSAGGLEKDKLRQKKYMEVYKIIGRPIRVFSFVNDNYESAKRWSISGYTRENVYYARGGLKYVENEKGEPGLRVNTYAWKRSRII